MAKKKRTSKKKPNPSRKPKSPGNEGEIEVKTKPKTPSLERQPLSKVVLRLSIFALIAAGLFYGTLNHVSGGNALWKIFAIASLPYIYLATRQQFFEVEGFFDLLRPTFSRFSLGLGAFVVANGLCFLLLQFAIQGRPAGDTIANILNGALFVLSPVFVFTLKLKAVTWTSFSALAGSTQLSLVLTSVLYCYGIVALAQLEKNHAPVEQGPLTMLQV